MSQPVNLVAILFDRNADQLASSAYAGLVEQLLKSGFYRAFRNIQTIGYLLIRQTLEDEVQNAAFAFA